VRIQLNGDPYALGGPLSILDLLAHLDIDPRRVAVERNFVIVKRDAYATTHIGEGDQIEIVNFVGGGGQSGHLGIA
jgi:thiamine biosynthesis protein ThiS